MTKEIKKKKLRKNITIDPDKQELLKRMKEQSDLSESELIDFVPSSSKTSLSEPLRYLTNAMHKRSTAFIFSDFIAPSFDEALRVASGKHDLVALDICDRREKEIPDVGFIRVSDPETGEEKWVDTSSKKLRDDYKARWSAHNHSIEELFKSNGIDMVTINTGEDYIKPLIALFKRR